MLQSQTKILFIAIVKITFRLDGRHAGPGSQSEMTDPASRRTDSGLCRNDRSLIPYHDSRITEYFYDNHYRWQPVAR